MLRALSEKKEKDFYVHIIFYKRYAREKSESAIEPNADKRKCTSTNEGKRFVDIKPEDISGRFLRLASASARSDVSLNFLTSHKKSVLQIYIIYTVPFETTRKNFFHLYLCIYVHLYLCLSSIYVRASKNKNIEVRRIRKVHLQ